tara:strand:+ start:74 stop:475 length:402 start_codon:yes stop_codon:yes gene_type:complete
MILDNISKRFISGLQKYNLTVNDLQNEWYYMGGNRGDHKKYFEEKYKDDEMPDLTDRCVCGHKIKNNCFITDGDSILILGTACAKRFAKPRQDRICEKCNQPHRNRKNNICNKCRTVFSISHLKNNSVILNFN